MLTLAAPALGALFAEPLFLAVDSAIVGHLGTAQMAGLGVASAVLFNVVLLCVFLAYGTTTVVARDIGAGRPRAGLEGGIDGMCWGSWSGEHSLPWPFSWRPSSSMSSGPQPARRRTR